MQIIRLILGRGKMRLPEIITAMGVEEMTEKGPREARESTIQSFTNHVG